MNTPILFTPLDLETWPRREIFYYFSKMAPTGYSLTVQLDITKLRQTLKSAGVKFYPAYLWLVTRTLHQQTEFKLAEKEGQLGYYHTLTPLYAIFHNDDHTFSLQWTFYQERFPDFYQAYLEDQCLYGKNHGILARPGQVPPENAYTISCVPWISFQHFAVHSYQNQPYYFPSIEAGKFYEQDGKILLPLSITCHHAATDGYHVHRFLETLQQEADTFEQYL